MPSNAAIRAFVATEESLRVYLQLHPEEWENLPGEVAERLTVDKMGAALWMNERFGMQLDVDNLHSVINFWKKARALVAAAGAAKVAAALVPTNDWIRARLTGLTSGALEG